MDFNKEMCPVVKVDGFIEKGKQFDIEINLPEDDRNVIFGVIKDCYKDPVADAVVKLIEVCYEYGKEERKPVSHTFTDEDGENAAQKILDNLRISLGGKAKNLAKNLIGAGNVQKIKKILER